MKKTIRLTESDLMRLVKRIIQEQGSIGNMVFKTAFEVNKGMDFMYLRKKLPSLVKDMGFIRLDPQRDGGFTATLTGKDSTGSANFKNNILTISIQRKPSKYFANIGNESFVYSFDLSQSPHNVTLQKRNIGNNTPQKKTMSTKELISFLSSFDVNFPPQKL